LGVRGGKKERNPPIVCASVPPSARACPLPTLKEQLGKGSDEKGETHEVVIKGVSEKNSNIINLRIQMRSVCGVWGNFGGGTKHCTARTDRGGRITGKKIYAINGSLR